MSVAAPATTPMPPSPPGALFDAREHEHVHCGVQPLHVGAHAEEAHPVGRCPFDQLRGHGVRFVGILRTDADHHETVVEALRCLEQLGEPLLQHEPPYAAHDDVVGADTQLGPHLGADVGPGTARVEPVEIHSVAEMLDLVGVGDPQPSHQRRVLGALDELGVGEAASHGLQGVDHRSLQQRVVGGGVDAVHGVDPDRDAHEPADDPSVDAWLRIVGVEDVGTLPANDLHQLPHGLQIGQGVDASGRGGERYVPDAPRLELGYPWAGRRDADRVDAVVARGQQLRHDEVAEAQVDRGEVGDLGAPVGHRPATSFRSRP